MKIVIASDSYKCCLSSAEVANAAETGIKSLLPEAEVVKVSVADGGEGTVESIVDSLGGEMRTARVSDPLGRPIDAQYGVAGDLAVIECASACGLMLVTPEERNPLAATTRGLGEMIVDAIDHGCKRFLVGLGGSATNDGGMGMVQAEGILEKTRGLKFIVACDVDTPYIGPAGATRVFGPQKGASPEDIEVLEARLTSYAEKILKDTGVDVSNMPGTGAAGGLGGAFRAYVNAELKRGVDMVLDQIEFDNIIKGADLVITGEGRSDFQTLKGKTPAGVLNRARKQGIKVALMSGGIKDEDLLHEGGFEYIERVTPLDMPLETAMQPDVAKKNIAEAVKRILSHN